MSKVKIYAGIAPFPQLVGFIRDIRPVWLLEEMGVDYDVEYINVSEDTQKPEFLAMNPFGKIPVVRDGEKTVFESGAICQYLADKYGKFIPQQGSLERLKHDQWYFAAIANFEFNALRVFACDVFYEKGPETDLQRKNAIGFLENWLPQLNRHLEKSRYLAGKEFQLCDLVLTTILRYLEEKKELQKYPAIGAWVRGNTDRPAFRRAVAKNGVPPEAKA